MIEFGQDEFGRYVLHKDNHGTIYSDNLGDCFRVFWSFRSSKTFNNIVPYYDLIAEFPDFDSLRDYFNENYPEEFI